MIVIPLQELKNELLNNVWHSWYYEWWKQYSFRFFFWWSLHSRRYSAISSVSRHNSLKSWKNAPRKIATWENCSTEKCPPMKFFCEVFLISNFHFYGNFLPQLKYILIQLIFFVINNNLFILYFPLFFSCAYIFDFQLWHIIFIIHRCETNNAGHRYLASEANCRKASLKLWESNNTSTHKNNILFFLWRKLLTDT